MTWSGILQNIMWMRSLALALFAVMTMNADDRLFEIRTYTSAEGKLDNLVARFRDHTVKLFEKHGMQNIGYWVPKDAPNTLIYILAYKNADAAKASWDAFRKDPEWVKVRTASEANGKIVEKAVGVFMTPTDFSKIK
jgi:hypothetical protein